MKLKQSEHDIQNAIISYLWMKGFYVQRNNAGKIRTEKGHMVNLSEPGTPDIMAFRKCSKALNAKASAEGLDVYFFEVKAGNNKTTFLQDEKMKQLTEYGAKCYTVWSLDEVQKIV